MVRIVVTPEQAEILKNTTTSVEVIDTSGNRLGYATPTWNREEIELQEDIEIARQRLNSDEPTVSFEEIMERIKLLEDR